MNKNKVLLCHERCVSLAVNLQHLTLHISCICIQGHFSLSASPVHLLSNTFTHIKCTAVPSGDTHNAVTQSAELPGAQLYSNNIYPALRRSLHFPPDGHMYSYRTSAGY